MTISQVLILVFCLCLYLLIFVFSLAGHSNSRKLSESVIFWKSFLWPITLFDTIRRTLKEWWRHRKENK